MYLELYSLCSDQGASPLDPLPKPKRPSLLSLGKVESGEGRRSGVLRVKLWPKRGVGMMAGVGVCPPPSRVPENSAYRLPELPPMQF